LPKIAADAGRLLRQLRQMATGATSQLRDELGPELADLDLTALHPKRFVARHLLADDDAPGMPAARVAAPLALGERPPFDSEAT
jgi:sec-independent protein translocase protein TatB